MCVYFTITNYDSNIGAKPTITAAFEKEWIDRMSEKIYKSNKSIKHLFITVDPSSGKDRNYYALSSMIFVNGQCVVCCYV